MKINYNRDLWNVIELYHPNYYNDDRALEYDVLFRYIEEGKNAIHKDDISWIKRFSSKKGMISRMKDIEQQLYKETINFMSYNNQDLECSSLNGNTHSVECEQLSISSQEYIYQHWLSSNNTLSTTSERNLRFKDIVSNLFKRQRLMPYYTKAKIAHLPNIIFDIILLNKKMLICLFIRQKTPKRIVEIDLEAIAVKYIHFNAKCYLLTFDSIGTIEAKRKIMNGDFIGLDDVIDCNTDEINIFVERLKLFDFEEAHGYPIIEGHLIKH